MGGESCASLLIASLGGSLGSAIPLNRFPVVPRNLEDSLWISASGESEKMSSGSEKTHGSHLMHYWIKETVEQESLLITASGGIPWISHPLIRFPVVHHEI